MSWCSASILCNGPSALRACFRYSPRRPTPTRDRREALADSNAPQLSPRASRTVVRAAQGRPVRSVVSGSGRGKDGRAWARLSAMQAAEPNIEERLDTLRTEYHQLRQAQITEELLDVVAGFKVFRTHD